MTVFDIHQRADHALIFIDGEDGRATINEPGVTSLKSGDPYMGKPRKMASPFTQPKKSAIPKLPTKPVAPLKLPKAPVTPALPPSNMNGSGGLVTPGGMGAGPTPPLITGTSNMMLPKPKGRK